MNDPGRHFEELAARSGSIMDECRSARRIEIEKLTARTVCVSGDGIHSLLLRPVDEAGRWAYSVSAPSTAHLLLAAAAHEATHVLYSCHNEDFAATLTELFGKVSAHAQLVRTALRRSKSAEAQVENTFSEAA